MIRFACGGCGKVFTVPERLAGKRARCRNCGQSVRVPEPAAKPADADAAPGPVRPPRRIIDTEGVLVRDTEYGQGFLTCGMIASGLLGGLFGWIFGSAFDHPFIGILLGALAVVGVFRLLHERAKNTGAQLTGAAPIPPTRYDGDQSFLDDIYPD